VTLESWTRENCTGWPKLNGYWVRPRNQSLSHSRASKVSVCYLASWCYCGEATERSEFTMQPVSKGLRAGELRMGYCE